MIELLGNGGGFVLIAIVVYIIWRSNHKEKWEREHRHRMNERERKARDHEDALEV